MESRRKNVGKNDNRINVVSLSKNQFVGWNVILQKLITIHIIFIIIIIYFLTN